MWKKKGMARGQTQRVTVHPRVESTKTSLYRLRRRRPRIINI